MKKLVLVACVAALAGCQSPAKIESAPVNAAVKASAAKGRIVKATTRVQVRSYIKDGSKRVEVTGARCKIESDELRASVVTPAYLIVPSFKQHRNLPNRGVPSALVATCTVNGKTASSSITAREKQLTTATGAGLAGALLTTAVSAAIATSSPWQYQGVLPVLFDK